MFRKINYFTFISLVLLFFSNNQKLFAQESSICTFTPKITGVFIPQGEPLPSKLLTSSEIGGTSAQFEADCTQPAKISVSAPIQLEGTVFSPMSSIAKVTNQLGGSTETGQAPLDIPSGKTDLYVDYAIDKGSRLAPGKYRYTVQFTVTPQ